MNIMSLLNDPRMAAAAGLLDPNGTFGNFGSSLNKGLLGAQQSQLMNLQRQSQEMKIKQAEEEAQRRKMLQQQFQQWRGTPGTEQMGPRRPQFQGQPLMAGGTGALADGTIGADDYQDLVGRLMANPETMQAGIGMLNALKPPAQGTSVHVSSGGMLDPFYKTVQDELGKDFIKKRGAATQASQSILNSREALNLLNKGMVTGTGASALVYMGGALRQLGYDLDVEPIANAQAYGGLMAKQTAQIIKEFGAGTGLSDADREYALKAAAGDINMTEESIRKLLQINAKANQNLIRDYNKEAVKVMEKGSVPYDMLIQNPEIPDFSMPAPQVDPDEVANKYLKPQTFTPPQEERQVWEGKINR